MFKKIMAIVLCAALAVSLAAPALAADESLDEELARVTLAVKQTLGIDDSYTGFSGDVTSEDGHSYWSLGWTGGEKSLNVRADENGKVLSYYLSEDYGYESNYGYAPVFAKVSRDDALPAAKAFLDKVLGDGETAEFGDYDTVFDTSDVNSYRFGGTVLLSGLKSPITFSVAVRTGDLTVTSFRRSDSYNLYSGDVPSAAAAVSADTAAGLLSGTFKMVLRYVLSDGGKTAVLRYLPVYGGDYIVRADTGELVDLSELNGAYEYEKESSASAADSVSGGSGLTDVEQSAVSSLQGVMSKDALDSAVRAVSGLGLDGGFALDSASYTKNTETGEIFCSLRYSEQITDKAAIKARFPQDYSEMEKYGGAYCISVYKYITANAVTGALAGVRTYTDSGYGEESALSADKLREKAEGFLGKNFAEKYAMTALNESGSSAEEGSFVYSESENGVLFPVNSVYITVSTYDGTVDSLSVNWTDGVTFEPADGVIGTDSAAAAYNALFKPVLQYAGVPAGDASDETVVKESGTEELILAYKYESDSDVIGIDAKTGAAVTQPEEESADIAYDDLDGCYGKAQIETLAKYGVGFPGTRFLPLAELTQKDALVLLLSAVGCSFGDGEEDALYAAAYDYKLLSRGEREPDRIMTRAGFVKMLVGASEYGPAAELKNAFVCGFTDDGSIPGDCFGYVAIAKALGVVRGDPNNRFNPGGAATRQDAAIMLYNYMSR